MSAWGRRRAGLFLLGAAAVAGGIVTAVPAAAATVPVTVVDNAYQPRNVTVAEGDVVVFTNTGQRQHTVTADDGSFNSGPMSAGQTFSRTFTTPGTYAYFCAFHGGPGGQGQAGTITVTAAQVTTTTVTAPAPSTTVAPPTTVVQAAATSTTAAPAGATTTTRATTTTTRPTTATTRAPTTTPPPTVAATTATTAPGTPLARTGSSWALSLVFFGAGLVLIGLGAVHGSRPPARPSP